MLCRRFERQRIRHSRRHRRRHGDWLYGRSYRARFLGRRKRCRRRGHNGFGRSFIFATYGRRGDWPGRRRGKHGRRDRSNWSTHGGFLRTILARRHLRTCLWSRLRAGRRINGSRFCDNRHRINRARFDYRRLDRTRLGTRLLGRHRRFSRLDRWQAKQSRVDAQRHRRLSLRIKGVGAGENAGKAVANKQRNRFAPRRKNHPKLSVNWGRPTRSPAYQLSRRQGEC